MAPYRAARTQQTEIRAENLSFPEAVEQLARLYALAIERNRTDLAQQQVQHDGQPLFT